VQRPEAAVHEELQLSQMQELPSLLSKVHCLTRKEFSANGLKPFATLALVFEWLAAVCLNEGMVNSKLTITPLSR
jgi:hypothetical protein